MPVTHPCRAMQSAALMGSLWLSLLRMASTHLTPASARLAWPAWYSVSSGASTAGGAARSCTGVGRACLPRHARLWPACHAMAWHSDEQKEIRWHLVRRRARGRVRVRVGRIRRRGLEARVRIRGWR